MEHVGHCPVCESSKSSGHTNIAGYFYVKCSGCAAYYLSPRLPESKVFELYAQESYYAGGGDGYSDYLSQEKALTATYASLLEESGKIHRLGGSFLDIGCAYGYMLSAAQKHFDKLTGVDMYPKAAAEVGKRAPKAAVCLKIPEGESYDLISLMQVIEHVYDPVAFLAGLKTRLKPRGLLILTTPYAGGSWFKLLGNRWPLYKAPEHVVLYSRESLKTLAERAGFTGTAELKYRQYFPCSLLAEKLHFPLFREKSGRIINIPGTSLAFACR